MSLAVSEGKGCCLNTHCPGLAAVDLSQRRRDLQREERSTVREQGSLQWRFGEAVPSLEGKKNRGRACVAGRCINVCVCVFKD